MPDYNYIYLHAKEIVNKLVTYKQYIVAKELNLSPSQLSTLLPLIKEIANVPCNG